MQHGKNPATGRVEFLKAINGSVLTAQIWAFPKLTGMKVGDLVIPEYEIVDLLAKTTGDWKQWAKINAQRKGTTWRIRPAVTPLIKWYLRVKFEKIMRELKS
jgi:hypothetical protein